MRGGECINFASKAAYSPNIVGARGGRELIRAQPSITMTVAPGTMQVEAFDSYGVFHCHSVQLGETNSHVERFACGHTLLIDTI